MLEIPKDVLEVIQDVIRQKAQRGESGWEYGEHEEDTLVGDFLGNLRTDKERVYIRGRLYEWQIIYKKFQGRGKRAYEKESGADAIITYEISDLETDERTLKSIIFQAKKGNSTQGLEAQKRKMRKVASAGNFVMRCTPNGYFCEQDDQPRDARISDFLADRFLGCKTGVEGMVYDPIRKELAYGHRRLINFELGHRLMIDVTKL